MSFPLRCLFLSLLAGLTLTNAQDETEEQEPQERQEERQWDWNLDVGVESRMFFESPGLAGQDNAFFQPSLTLDPEWSWESASGDDQLVVKPFARLDAIDSERSHWDIREAFWKRHQGDWELSLGIDKVYWGVVESRHLVDVINQVDGLEDIDEEDKLGQPMLRAARSTDWGRFELLLMTGFRERRYPGEDGRLRGPLKIDTDHPVYEASQEEWAPDIAARYSHYLGPVDLGLHLFHGTSREPRLVPESEQGLNEQDRTGQDAATQLVPHYDIMSQAGIDLQYTADATLWKAEAIVREATDDLFGAASIGVEHTLYQIADSDADLGLLAELHVDDRGDADPATLYDEDVFLGLRLALNDAQDTSVLAGAIRDADSSETLWTVEAKRRFGDDWVVDAELRGFSGVDEDSPFAFLRDDSFLNLRLTRYF